MTSFTPVAPSLVRRLADFMELYEASKRSAQTLDQERFELLVDTVDRMDQHVFGALFRYEFSDAVLNAAERLVAQRLVERKRKAEARKARELARERERAAVQALLLAA